ncbi:hypothetical protein ADUPG1_012144 [Aduncisulcus paluster]|uniref:Uncharacterized protein n=1 Tax=Aduncisulcus paluster TaxID=2918883 RepID=A0ABQ5K0P1_9EUKA|nr:hypothetical protein ADUPG1_012144 [Aduncisulcus paluster]
MHLKLIYYEDGVTPKKYTRACLYVDKLGDFEILNSYSNKLIIKNPDTLLGAVITTSKGEVASELVNVATQEAFISTRTLIIELENGTVNSVYFDTRMEEFCEKTCFLACDHGECPRPYPEDIINDTSLGTTSTSLSTHIEEGKRLAASEEKAENLDLTSNAVDMNNIFNKAPKNCDLGESGHGECNMHLIIVFKGTDYNGITMESINSAPYEFRSVSLYSMYEDISQ